MEINLESEIQNGEMGNGEMGNGEMGNGEMGNSPASWGDVPTDACARGRWNNRFRPHVIKHVLDNSTIKCNVSNNFYIQIT